MAYLIIMQDKNKVVNECKEYDDGSDLLDDLEWLPNNHELKALIQQTVI